MDIPFKSKDSSLPDNRSIAEKRLQSVTNWFLRNPELHTKYKCGIQELLDKGCAEKVPEQKETLDGLGICPFTMLSMKTNLRSYALYFTVMQPLVVLP